MARILVVEDDESFAALARKVLTTRGHDVTVARTGPSGVERALSDATDLVLMDLRLPDIDGWEATTHIKAVKPDLPVIACSANVMRADVDRADALSAKARAGRLTVQEEHVLDNSLTIGSVLEFLKSKARRSLRQAQTAK